jgi:chromosome segregation protein
VHITELRLAGFKSFVDPIKAPIEPGLTGIVGPNGCGKSNLLEAVRWVMGAASAKAMRAEEMDDVIFAGSAARPLREHAEVTLVLADAAGKAPGPLASADLLEVVRRIRRGAGSTYRINGKEVRAKDVHLLFADAATGANSPALVRQGQVSELIAAKPENRRRILEDAAGVAGLHARRHEADLKLRAAEANLTRLEEVLVEIDAQAQGLKKQARQAERYRGLAQNLREIEALLLHRRWREAQASLAAAETAAREAARVVAAAAQEASAAERAANAAREALAPLREEEAVAAAVLRRLEGVRVGLERDLAEAEAALARADEQAKRVEEERARVEALGADANAALARLKQESDALGAGDDAGAEAALKAARETADKAIAARKSAEDKLEALAAEAAAKQARAQALAQAAGAARAQVERLLARKAQLEANARAFAVDEKAALQLAAAREAAGAAGDESEQARAALAQAEAALQRIEKADEAAALPFRAAESAARELEAEVRALEKLAPADGAKFPPVLASIEVEAGYERALAAALGDDLDASLAKDAPVRWGGAEAPKAQIPAEAESLARFVKAPPALAARLSLAGVVDADDGARLQKLLTPGARLVSKAGDLWRWDGFSRRADAPQPAAARLEHKNRLAAARAELKSASEKLAKAKQAAESARDARRNAETSARALRAEAPKLAAKAAEAARLVEKLDSEAARGAERRADIEAQIAALAPDLVAARAHAEEASRAAEAPAAPSDGAALAAARAETEKWRAAAADASAALQGLSRERAQREARRIAVFAETAQWRARGDACKRRSGELDKEAKGIAATRAAALAAPEKARAALAKLMDEAGGAEARRAKAADAAQAAETAAREAETAARAKEAAHAAARESRAGAEAHREAAAARLTALAAAAHEQTGLAPEGLAGASGALISGALAAGPIHDVERRLERLKAERDAAGPVNLRAEEELAETLARLETLNTEKADVASAVAKLRGAITKLNNEGRARLNHAFDIVQARFAQLFETLFEGGQATLKLTENEDPLMVGLEIYAQPPGKKLSTLSLMSGGEQALTATALIFAVFLANPAPLCVLDEVDAPLDDANVDRFCRMLEEMKKLTETRFVVITHNPVTMSRMDRLYGVTMPEQGVSQLVSVDLSGAQKLAATA